MIEFFVHLIIPILCYFMGLEVGKKIKPNVSKSIITRGYQVRCNNCFSLTEKVGNKGEVKP